MESHSKIHPKNGKILQFLKANIDNAIGAILIVNLFANTVGAAGVGVQAIRVFGEAWEGIVALLYNISFILDYFSFGIYFTRYYTINQK